MTEISKKKTFLLTKEKKTWREENLSIRIPCGFFHRMIKMRLIVKIPLVNFYGFYGLQNSLLVV